MGLDRHDDTLRSSRGHCSSAGWVVEHPEKHRISYLVRLENISLNLPQAHRYDLGFHLPDGREHIRVQRVRDAITLICRYNERSHILSAICI